MAAFQLFHNTTWEKSESYGRNSHTLRMTSEYCDRIEARAGLEMILGIGE